MTPAPTFTAGRGPDGAVVLTATGEIDMSNADAFSGALTDARRDAVDASLVVDLTRVEYIDSAGLAALFPHVDSLRLVAGPLLAPVLTIAGLEDVLTVRSD
jgi:anti-sigma B factor antagonist